MFKHGVLTKCHLVKKALPLYESVSCNHFKTLDFCVIKSCCVIAQGGKKKLLLLHDTRTKVSDAFKKRGSECISSASWGVLFPTALSPAVSPAVHSCTPAARTDALLHSTRLHNSFVGLSTELMRWDGHTQYSECHGNSQPVVQALLKPKSAIQGLNRQIQQQLQGFSICWLCTLLTKSGLYTENLRVCVCLSGAFKLPYSWHVCLTTELFDFSGTPGQSAYRVCWSQRLRNRFLSQIPALHLFF